jgi:hypothetical protein
VPYSRGEDMAHLFQVGAGSGGVVVLDLLARDPLIDRVTLVEPDVYQPHNVHRHLFPTADVGRHKSTAAFDWLRDRRPELPVVAMGFDLTDPARQDVFEAAVAGCDVGVCAADNEPAKYQFDALFRRAGKPWTLGEVLSGGIAGWVHRFWPGGPCYGCVASHLQREPAGGDPLLPAPDYSHPGGAVPETAVPASRASVGAVAGLHAAVTLDLLRRPPADGAWTSLLLPLARVPGVFDDPFRTYRFTVARNPGCLVCSAVPPPAGEDLDAALDSALARLGHD